MKKEQKHEEHKLVVVKIVVLLVLGFLVEFFLRESYGVNSVYSIVISLASLGLFYFYWRKSFFHFLLVSIISIGFFISLEISFDMGLFSVFFISLAVALIFGTFYTEFENRKNYALLLLVAFVLIWIILAFNVKYRSDWMLENYLTIPFVLLIVIVSRWFRFSKTSNSLIFIYMLMHIIGSHYTYSEVPFGFWLQTFFGLDRNHYDRIVHFSFGFLLAYPVREVFKRIGNYKGFWALFAPVMLVFGISSFYEIIEWWVAVIFGGDLGIAYLGTQGDIWDAQKDMFLAGIGSLITMFVTFVVIMTHDAKGYWIELKDSFKVKHSELGEVALEKMNKKNK